MNHTKELLLENLKVIENLIDNMKIVIDKREIEENEYICPNDSNNWIQSPLDKDSDLISIQGDELIFTTHEGKGRVVICKKGERFYFDKKLINNLGEHEHIRNLIFKFNENKNAGRFYHLDFPNGEPNKEAYVSGYDDLGKPIIEQKPFQINCSPIGEEKRNSGCFEKVYIYVPITDEYKVLNKSASDGKIFYRLALKKEIPKEFMILDGAVYHSGVEVTKQVSEIVMKLINDYEAGLGKGGEKKDEILYKGRKLCDIVENAYILEDILDVPNRYFLLVDECDKEVTKILTTSEGAFIKDSSCALTKLDEKSTYRFMLKVAKYLENKKN